jgi:hypothetical protein
MKDYELAFMDANGEWDVVESFEASDDAAANKWAEANEERMRAEYGNDEWYILHDGKNINS